MRPHGPPRDAGLTMAQGARGKTMLPAEARYEAATRSSQSAVAAAWLPRCRREAERALPCGVDVSGRRRGRCTRAGLCLPRGFAPAVTAHQVLSAAARRRTANARARAARLGRRLRARLCHWSGAVNCDRCRWAGGALGYGCMAGSGGKTELMPAVESTEGSRGALSQPEPALAI